MAYNQLAQAQALAKTKSQTIAIQMPVVPQLSGKLASIDPTGTAEFNVAMQTFVTDLITKISQALTESPRQES